MNISKGSLVTLDNNVKYLVISKIEYQGASYIFIVDINDNLNRKICYEKKESNLLKIVEVKDGELIKKLILLFNDDIKDVLNSAE